VTATSEKARKHAAGILAVLSGEKTTVEATRDMEVSLPRYYQLEARAIEGLVAALEPRNRGRRKTPEDLLRAERKERERLNREVARLSALLRAAHRSLGVKPPAAPGEKRKGRKTHRARRAIRMLTKPVPPFKGVEGEEKGDAVAPAVL
jgi:hypothetical protein